MRFEELKNLRVAILGLGREGLAVRRHIRRRFPEKPLYLFAESGFDEAFLQSERTQLDHCVTGVFDFAQLSRFDVLVRSAGVSIYRPVLRELKSAGVRFTTASNLWFAENPGAKTICISGTMGKSTTAALTAHLLQQAGASTRLAGNIGNPMLDCDNTDPDWWVIELSSYQLADLEASIDIAVLLNLSDEHLDWHGGLQRYRADKLRLAGLAGGGRVVANYRDEVLKRELAQCPGRVWFNHENTWLAADDCVLGAGARRVPAPAALPGRHNMQNLAAALTIIDETGLEVHRPDEALQTFSGLPHRLQLIGEKDGVRYIDDSISTTPVSVSAALATIGHEKTVLLLGGLDRGLDWSGFAGVLAVDTPHAVITMPDNGDRIFACLEKAGVKPAAGLHRSPDLRGAVALAAELAPPSGCVLLSPGAPSFPRFKDFEDRGNQFIECSGIEKQVSSAHKKGRG